MRFMTTAPATQLTRLLLVGDPARRPGPGRDTPIVRHYRLARLRLNDGPSTGSRFDHLRRSYD
jgi:hypothetical protein